MQQGRHVQHGAGSLQILMDLQTSGATSSTALYPWDILGLHSGVWKPTSINEKRIAQHRNSSHKLCPSVSKEKSNCAYCVLLTKIQNASQESLHGKGRNAKILVVQCSDPYLAHSHIQNTLFLTRPEEYITLRISQSDSVLLSTDSHINLCKSEGWY
jgi:hypothetical protein